MPPNRRKTLLPLALSAVAAAGAVWVGGPAAAQHSRTEAPDYRQSGPALLVCTGDEGDFTERNGDVAYHQRIENERLWQDCVEDGYGDIAEAVADAEPDTRIQILPGRYGIDQTIRIDRSDLQIEGLGDGPEDVHITADGAETAMAVDGAERLYLKGFTVTGAAGAGLLATGADGLALDAVAAVDNAESGLRIEDSDGVVADHCLAEGNGAAGIAVADSRARIAECTASGNLIGLLHTGSGESEAELNRLHDNSTGLAVTDTADGHRFTVSDNEVYDNNAGSGQNRHAPDGVGVLIANASNTTVSGNHLWGQQTAAAMVWGDGTLADNGSDGIRFEDNHLGYRDDGQRSRNRVDLWWDGEGSGNCFDEPEAVHTSPAVMPGCDAATAPDRVVGDPIKALKVWRCGGDLLGDGPAPGGCDWYGARFTDRLEFQAAVAFAATVLFGAGLGWFAAARSPAPPAPMSMTFSAIATGAGALLLVLASWSGRADYEALAVGLWGLGWVLAGRAWYGAGLRFFGGFTVLVGALAILDGIDRGLWPVPVVPAAPGWAWALLLPLWAPVALAAVFRRWPPEPAPPRVQRTPVTAPASDRFDW